MARDGVLPQGIAAIHPGFQTPARAIILQSVWVTALIVFWSSLEGLMMYTGFALVVFSALAVLAVFVLRARRPDLPRPYRVPGYPLVPALYVAASVWMGIFTVRGRPKESLMGLLTVAAGLPVYWWMRRK
jgi:APA family basic amino acid/polyamine antiporter